MFKIKPKPKKESNLLLETERDQYKKALVKALDGLKELSNMSVFASPTDILKDKMYAEYLRQEIIDDLQNNGIADPTIKHRKSTFPPHLRDSIRIINFKKRTND